MGQVTVGFGPPVEVVTDEVAGAVFTNHGPATVSYSDSQNVRDVAEGSLASGASATLYGSVWLYAAARADVGFVLLAPSVGSGSGLVNAGDYHSDTEYSVDDVVCVGRRAFVLEEHEGDPPPPPLDDNAPWDGIDYPAAAAQATTFGRTIGAVGRAGDNVFLGYGDYSANTGPVDVAEAALTDLRAEPTAALSAFESEQIILFRRLADGRVMAPSVDPRGSVGGHIAERATDGTWAEHLDRITDGGLHIFDLVEGPEADLLFACGSGYEVGTSGDSGAAIYKSTDAGATWTLDYIIAGPNVAESNRFYWLAVVGDTVYARNSETGVDGEAERMIRWTLADGWDEVAHDLPSALGPGQSFRDGYVLPAGHWGYSEVRGALRYFDGTTVTTLADAVVGFDVGDDGALYYCTTGGALRVIPSTGDLEATDVATLDSEVVSDLVGMVALPGEDTFVFGGPDAHLRTFTVGQRNPWRPLAPKDVTGADGLILLNLLPPQGDDGSPGLEVFPIGEGGVEQPAWSGGAGGWGEGALYVIGGTGFLIGQIQLDDYADVFDNDAFMPVPLLTVPSWMTDVPEDLADLANIYTTNVYGWPFVPPERRVSATMYVTAYGFAAGSKAAVIARIPETIVGPNVSRYDASPGGDYYTVSIYYPIELRWGAIPAYDEDYNVISVANGLYGQVPLHSVPQDHMDLLFAGSISPASPASGYIAINNSPLNGNPIVLSFLLGDRP